MSNGDHEDERGNCKVKLELSSSHQRHRETRRRGAALNGCRELDTDPPCPIIEPEEFFLQKPVRGGISGTDIEALWHSVINRKANNQNQPNLRFRKIRRGMESGGDPAENFLVNDF